MHSVILNSKSKAGKNKYFFFFIKISPLELKPLNSKNRCYDITIPVRKQQVDWRWRSQSELNVSIKHNPHPIPETPPNPNISPFTHLWGGRHRFDAHRVHSREAGQQNKVMRGNKTKRGGGGCKSHDQITNKKCIENHTFHLTLSNSNAITCVSTTVSKRNLHTSFELHIPSVQK